MMVSPVSESPEVVAALDDPLIALTQRCHGDLRKVLTAFFSFLHRRTDFYMVPQEDDLLSKLGFREGDAEKLLVASFRQFPLRRLPRPSPPSSSRDENSKSNPNSHARIQNNQTMFENRPDDDLSSQETSAAAGRSAAKELESEVQFTKEGLQIPVGNGGTTDRYKWTQSLEECTVIIPVPNGWRAKDLDVHIKTSSISVRSKQTAEKEVPAVLVEGDLVENIVPAESTWTLEGGVLVLSLYKKVKTFWATVLQGDAKIDASLVDSRRHIQDYDESTQAQIRKIIFQQKNQVSHANSSISPAQLAAAQPITPHNLPPGAEFIELAKLDSLNKPKT